MCGDTDAMSFYLVKSQTREGDVMETKKTLLLFIVLEFRLGLSQR